MFKLRELPSGKRLHNELENHHFQWENPRSKWQCSIATLVYQRVTLGTYELGMGFTINTGNLMG